HLRRAGGPRRRRDVPGQGPRQGPARRVELSERTGTHADRRRCHDAAMDALTGQTVELLQTLIRNECVNDGTGQSGQEIRNAEVLAGFLEGSGVDLRLFHAAPGRTTLVARVEGSDPSAPSL